MVKDTVDLASSALRRFDMSFGSPRLLGLLIGSLPQLRHGSLRGSLLPRLLGTSLGALLLLGSLGGCASINSNGSALTVAVASQFSTIDPGLNTEVVGNIAISHMYSGMFKKDEDNNAINELCESYEVAADGLTYTFRLLEGIMWSDGVAITANDFVYSYLRALSYGEDNAWAVYNFLTFVEGAAEYNARALEAGDGFDCLAEDAGGVGVKALDDRTLEIRLKKPCPYLPGLMSANAWLPVRADFAPQHESLWALTPGYPASGAYELAECDGNEAVSLKKNPRYFRADEVLMDTISLKAMPDGVAQALAFQAGEVDVAMSVSTESAAGYAGTENLWIVPRCANYFLAINSGPTGPSWAKDVSLRRALAMAIDKDALAEALGGDEFYRGLNGYVPHGLRGVSGDFRAEGDADGYALKYDVARAKRLLADSGYGTSNPLAIRYKYSDNDIHGAVAAALQPMWQAVGVDVTFEAVEPGSFYDQLDAGDFEISRYGYIASDDAIQYLDLWTGAMQVVAAVDDPAFDKMVDAAGMISDLAEYYRALHAAEDYLCEENAYVIPLFDYTSPALVKSGLRGYRSLGGDVDFIRCRFGQEPH
ncbi:MAG: peptide ABC transporter substrate-binding protein [Clostridiales bacterium]|jgi:oligopeptide transport system substrate-binding protein|nr:peptide ABC transporter substrate-binding protein [Clostridiales bacterium]